MAWMMFSSRSLTTATVKTLSIRRVVLGGVATVASTLFIGMGLGFGLAQYIAPPAQGPQSLSEGSTPPAVAESKEKTDPGVLVGRLAEISGRVVQLETEAQTLIKRIALIEQSNPQGIKPGNAQGNLSLNGPKGGPWIKPVQGNIAAAEGFKAVGETLPQVEHNLEALGRFYAMANEAVSDRAGRLMRFPSRVPLPGAERTSGFGYRHDPFNGHVAFHSGQDFAAQTGEAILASAGGRVIRADFFSDYGRTVEIDHGNGLITRYAHASKLLVKEGDLVKPLDAIALVGSSGRSTGAHLHFEVMNNGAFENPADYLMDRAR